MHTMLTNHTFVYIGTGHRIHYCSIISFTCQVGEQMANLIHFVCSGSDSSCMFWHNYEMFLMTRVNNF